MGLIYPRLILNLLCSQELPWPSVIPASVPWVPGLKACITTFSFCLETTPFHHYLPLCLLLPSDLSSCQSLGSLEEFWKHLKMATPVGYTLNLVIESLLPTDYSLGKKKPQMSLYSIRNKSRKKKWFRNSVCSTEHLITRHWNVYIQ